VKNKNSIPFLVLIIFSIFSFYKCDQSKYDKSYDELVKGLYFGMEKKAFFEHCWDLNQNGETQHGTIDNNVMYMDSINFDPKVVVNFYPVFLDDKISKMPMSFYFHGWAPWNKNELSQDILSKQVEKLFEKRYEGTFEERKAPNGRPFKVMFVGPLMIRVYNDIDEMVVKADITHKYFKEK